MKNILLFFVIALSFSFQITSKQYLSRNRNEFNKIEKRRLLESYSNRKLIFIGIFHYDYYYNYVERLNFQWYLKNYNNFQFNNNFYSELLINRINGEILTSEIECKYQGTKNEILEYFCSSLNINTSNITNIRLNNYSIKYYNDTKTNITIPESDIILSSLAEISKDYIFYSIRKSEFYIFNLDNIEINNNEVRLKGNININLNNLSKLYFMFPDNFIFGYISNEKDEIVLNLTEKINKQLNGWVGLFYDDEYFPYYNSTNPYYWALIIAKENVNDLLVYPMNKNSFVQFFGYGGYKKPTSDRNATSRASFKGSIYYLKYYMRFTVKIKYENSGTLEEDDDSYAYGIRNVTDIDKGKITYEITFPNTQGKKIIDIKSNNDFKFSDNNLNYTDIGTKINMVTINDNITNPNDFDIPMFNIINKDISSEHFSIDFNVSEKLVIEKPQNAYLGYYPLDSSKKEEIECSLENKTENLRIICSPKNIIYTYYSTMIIKIPQIKSSGKLRFLQTKENSTFYASTIGEEYMDYEYNPVINTFAKKVKRNNELSAGAIIGIIFSTIAVIAIVALAIFFLNKSGKIHPQMKINDATFQNSTANIIK